ncbi:MAG: DNA cytosine methyltransferase [Elusimicrobiota bacterium]
MSNTHQRRYSPHRRPIVIDFFAGAGGLSLGFEQAGFDVAAAVEIDPIHCGVHHYNFPNSATICASVTDLSGAEIRRRANIGDRDIDVVCGGAPCQGFSMIGHRALNDPRNRLVFHFVRLIKELNPKHFVFENVRGLTIGEHKKFLDEIVEAAASAGYEVLLPWRVLNAVDYGVPQDRKRLFLIGTRKGLRSPVYPTPINRVTVKDAIGDLPDADGFDELLSSDSVATRFKTGSIYARRLRCLESDPSDFGYRRNFDQDVLTSSARTSHTPLSRRRFVRTPCGDTEPISRFFKLAPHGVCNTLRAGTDSARGAFTSPRPIHPTHARVITVREAARLHSYPDWFRFHATKWHGFREIGNSVPPLLARAVASEVIKALEVRPARPTVTLDTGEPSLLNLNMTEAANLFNVSANVIGQRLRKTASPSAETSRTAVLAG